MARTRKPESDVEGSAGETRPSSSELVPTGEFLLYETEDGRTRIECRFADDTLWLSQALIASLFQVSVPTVSEHLKGVFAEGELAPEATVRKLRTVRREGPREVARLIDHYSLDAILAVGYRVRSPRGTQFRQWATARLSEFLVKGFAIDDERLKHPPAPGSATPDYFDELLERIRDIRASEARMYLRVREIFALAADYDPARPDVAAFFKVIQNKLHFAATGKTAAELIADRADHARPNMGLTAWAGGRVGKADVTIAKNYLDADEIAELNRIVVMWLDFAEDQARRRAQVFLRDWETRLDEFLRFNDRRVLPGPGTVSHQQAADKAAAEYEQFTARRRAPPVPPAGHGGVQALEAAARELGAPTNAPTKPGKTRAGKGRPRS
jgi:hypothetical protein